MLFPVFTTVIYLMSWCSLHSALPTSGTNSRDSIFGPGFEQTTRRSRPTTTIDYDLADFDEFGNDPGMYDVAGSPDAINLVDDNDKGFDYHQGFATGQSLLESIYTIAPGISKPPANSGGISDEIQGKPGYQREGGPSDEGVYTNANQEQGVKDERVLNSVQYNKQYMDTDNDHDKQDTGRNGKNGVNRIRSTNVTPPEEVSSKSQKDVGAPPDSNENDKSDAVDTKASDGSSRGKNGSSSLTVDSGNETQTNSHHKESGMMTRNETHLSHESSFASPDTSSKDINVETDDVSIGLSDTARSSKDTSEAGSVETGISRESTDDSSSYSVYNSNSQEFSRSSTSQSSEQIDSQYNDMEEISSLENISWEDTLRPQERGASQTKNSGSVVENKGWQSQPSSSENGKQLSVEESGSQSSRRENSLSTSDENDSHSTSDENNSHSNSDDNGSVSSSDETSMQSSSDESILESASDDGSTSDENMSRLLSDDNNSKTSSAETTESSSSNQEKDIDNDIDQDSDNDAGTNVSESTSRQTSLKVSIAGDTTDSSQKGSSLLTDNISESGAGSGATETSGSSKDLAKCFTSPEEDGKYCYLLRSLYNLCNAHFKQECLSNIRANRRSKSDKASQNSESLHSLGSLSDTSSESVEDPFSDFTASVTSWESSSSSGSKADSMSIETVENLSASFEKTSGIFEVIDLIRDTCQGICTFAESHTGKHPNTGTSGSDVDIDSSESSDEEDWIDVSDEAFTDSDEDEIGSLNLSEVTLSEGSQSATALKQDEDVARASSDEYSSERNSNERSIDDSFASTSSTESMTSADSSGDRSFEYSSRQSENSSE